MATINQTPSEKVVITVEVVKYPRILSITKHTAVLITEKRYQTNPPSKDAEPILITYREMGANRNGIQYDTIKTPLPAYEKRTIALENMCLAENYWNRLINRILKWNWQYDLLSKNCRFFVTSFLKELENHCALRPEVLKNAMQAIEDIQIIEDNLVEIVKRIPIFRKAVEARDKKRGVSKSAKMTQTLPSKVMVK